MSRKCPTCNRDLQLRYPVEINQQVICENCGEEMEVIWAFPLELAKIHHKNHDPSRLERSKRKVRNK